MDLVTTLEIQVSDDAPPSSVKDVPWLNDALSVQAETLGSTATTAQVDSYLFTATLIEEAQARGMNIVYGEVVGFVCNGSSQITGVKLEDGTVIECDYALIAMGAWSASLNSWFRYDRPNQPNHAPIQIPVTGTRAHSVIFRSESDRTITPHALFVKALLKGQAKEVEIYPRPNGNVYICGEGDDVLLPYSSDQIEPNPTATNTLISIANTIIPRLNDFEIIKQQACYLPYSDTGSPLIGRVPSFSNLLVATGHSCWGILNAPATGLCIAQLILTGRCTFIDLSPFSVPN